MSLSKRSSLSFRQPMLVLIFHTCGTHYLLHGMFLVYSTDP